MHLDGPLRILNYDLAAQSVDVDRAGCMRNGHCSVLRVDVEPCHSGSANLGVARLYLHGCFARHVEPETAKGKTTVARSATIAGHSQVKILRRPGRTCPRRLKFD